MVISQPIRQSTACRLPWLLIYYHDIIRQFVARNNNIVALWRITMDNRFVVQEHTTADGVHWDLMVERGEVLATFRLAEAPENALNRAIGAVKIFDHPLRFLTYEGPVQKGTGRVRIVDRGDCNTLDETDDVVTLDLQGAILRGEFTLARTEGTSWLFFHVEK